MMHEHEPHSDPVYGPQLDNADELAEALYQGKEVLFGLEYLTRENVIDAITDDSELIDQLAHHAYVDKDAQAEKTLFIEQAIRLIDETYYFNCSSVPVVRKAGTGERLKKLNEMQLERFLEVVA